MRAPDPEDDAPSEAREPEPPDQRDETIRRTGPILILR